MIPVWVIFLCRTHSCVAYLAQMPCGWKKYVATDTRTLVGLAVCGHGTAEVASPRTPQERFICVEHWGGQLSERHGVLRDVLVYDEFVLQVLSRAASPWTNLRTYACNWPL